MKILVINAGSSSLKFQLIDMENEQVIAKGICEEIGGKSGFKFKVPGREDYKAMIPMPTLYFFDSVSNTSTATATVNKVIAFHFSTNFCF